MSFPYGATVDGYINQFLTFYNGGAYNAATNPGGLANGGHRVNFIPILQQYATIASSVADAANYAGAQASSAAASATTASTAATALMGTSTTSVTIGAGAQTFITQAAKSFNVGTFVQAVSNASPTTHYMLGQVTSYNNVSGQLTISVAAGAFGGSGARADWTIYGRSGPQGTQGIQGIQGIQGATLAHQWTFSALTVDSDPGNGLLKFNNATYSAVTYLFVDNLEKFGSDATTWVDSWDDSTSTPNRGTIFIQQVDIPQNFAVFAMNLSPGVVEVRSGYRAVPVSFVGGLGTIVDGSTIAVAFYRSGNKGQDGVGLGDTTSDISSSTIGRIALYNSTDGKHITQAAVGIGTSGAAVPRLDTVNTWSANQAFGTKVDVQQDLGLSGDITPAQITSNQDNYAPAGGTTASVFRLSTDAARNITGITGGYDGRLLLIQNVGANDINLLNDTTSTAANRFLFGADYTLGPGRNIWLYYDATQSRWTPTSNTGPGGSSVITAFHLAGSAHGYPENMINGALAISAAGSALTIALKTLAGNDPSVSDPVDFLFRNATAATGDYVRQRVTAASSLVISSGSTLGVISATALRLWIVAFNDGGTFRLGVINCSVFTPSLFSPDVPGGVQIYPLAEGLASSVQETGAGAADNAGVIYTNGAAVTSKPMRILAYAEWSPSGITAGAWTTTNLSLVQPFGPGIRLPGQPVQLAQMYTAGTQFATTSLAFVATPLSQQITLSSPANITRLAVDASGFGGTSPGAHAFFRDATQLASLAILYSGAQNDASRRVWHDKPNTAAAVTYSVRVRSTDGSTVSFPWSPVVAATTHHLSVEELMG